jgi:hypothetical protein
MMAKTAVAKGKKQKKDAGLPQNPDDNDGEICNDEHWQGQEQKDNKNQS